jgi:hypothetical protein
VAARALITGRSAPRPAMGGTAGALQRKCARELRRLALLIQPEYSNWIGSGASPACNLKTLRGITAPGILGYMVTRREKIAKICLPLGITNKSDFVFTRPRPKGDINRARSEGQARQRENLIATASFRRISVSQVLRKVVDCQSSAHRRMSAISLRGKG